MKKHLFVFLKSIAFFGFWALFISVGLIITPSFVESNPAFLRFWWELIPLVVVGCVTFLFVKVVEKNKLITGIFRNDARNSLIGIIFGIAWIGITVLISTLIGSFHWGNFNHVPYLPVWILSALLNVAMQEYLVRGYLFNLFRKEYNVITAVIITTLLFTLMHGGAFEAGIIAVFNVLSMSVFMSLLLIYTGNLIAPIIAHGIWNIIGFLTGCVSLAEDYPVLLNCELTGNKIISGGEYKLEGSIIVLVINIINILVLLCLMRKKIVRQD